VFDSHCHLDAEEYDDERADVLARAYAAGVSRIMVPGYEPREWDRLGPLMASDARLMCGVGLHPLYLHELSAPERASALAQIEPRIRALSARAVGECGLDAVVAKRGGLDLDAQSAIVDVHVELARSLDLPLILHCVRAHGRMLALLERHGPLKRGGVMHAFGGPVELIEGYRKLGFYFSFGGIVTHDNAHKPRRALVAVPSERLLVETDGPSQVPAFVQRGRSEPADVTRVLAAAALLRGGDFDTLARVTHDNALSLFGQ
jgi:TatD DNase family protein